MFKFSNIVSNILAEQISQNQPAAGQNTKPAWIQKIINKHNSLGLGTIDDTTYQKVVNTAFRANQNRLADKELESVYDAARLLDAIEQFKESTKNAKTTEFKILNNTSPDYIKAGNDIANNIERYTSAEQWKPQTGIVSATYYKLQDTYDKMGAVALSTFDSKSVLDTTLEIVKRRTTVFDRITNLKSLTQPFVKLINDILRYPDEYMAGQKKVSSDYFKIVDNLYITNLFQVGKAAKDFYATQITRLKIEPQGETTPDQNQQTQLNQQVQNTGRNAPRVSPTGTPPAQQVGRGLGDSINYFEQLVNSVLLNEVGLVQTITQGARNIGSNIKTAAQAASTPENRQLFTQIFKKVRADQANYTNFISNKPIEYKIIDPNTGKETGDVGITDSNAYTIGQIKKMEAPEARALIKALEGIAQYTRKRVGAGEMASRLGKGIGALSSGIGPVN